MADDYFRKSGVRDKANLIFASASGEIFKTKKYAETLEKVIARKEIKPMYNHNLIKIRARSREAVFENLATGEQVCCRTT